MRVGDGYKYLLPTYIFKGRTPRASLPRWPLVQPGHFSPGMVSSSLPFFSIQTDRLFQWMTKLTHRLMAFHVYCWVFHLCVCLWLFFCYAHWYTQTQRDVLQGWQSWVWSFTLTLFLSFRQAQLCEWPMPMLMHLALSLLLVTMFRGQSEVTGSPWKVSCSFFSPLQYPKR